MESLKGLTLKELDFKEAKIFMDLALQSTCKEVTLQLEYDGFMESPIIRHDFLKRISELTLSGGESCSVPSEQLTKPI
jgi:hypothetical protein